MVELDEGDAASEGNQQRCGSARRPAEAWAGGVVF